MKTNNTLQLSVQHIGLTIEAKTTKLRSDLIGRRPFVITDLQSQFKAATTYIVPILHATIYRVPEAVENIYD